MVVPRAATGRKSEFFFGAAVKEAPTKLGLGGRRRSAERRGDTSHRGGQGRGCQPGDER